MFTRLQHKPFYFLTDRQTHQQYFVNKTSTPQQRLIYYPVQYQTMTEKQIQKYKTSIRNKFFKWTALNHSKLEKNDRNIVFWKLFDVSAIILLGFLSARFLRKLMFRTQLPVLQMKLESFGLNVRLLKAYTSYFICFLTTKTLVQKVINETYLTDLAFQYKSNFSQRLNSPCDLIFNQLSEKRFGSAAVSINEKQIGINQKTQIVK